MLTKKKNDIFIVLNELKNNSFIVLTKNKYATVNHVTGFLQIMCEESNYIVLQVKKFTMTLTSDFDSIILGFCLLFLIQLKMA